MAQFFEYPLLSQERIKLRTSNLAGSQGPSEQNPLKNLGENGAWAWAVPGYTHAPFSKAYILSASRGKNLGQG